MDKDKKLLFLIVMYLYLRFFMKRGLKRERDIEDDDDDTSDNPETSHSGDSSSSVNKGGKKAKFSNPSVDLDKLELDILKAIQQLTEVNNGPTVEECRERLKLLELDPDDPLYLAACQTFELGSKGQREVWMAIPFNPEVLKGWIKMTAKSLGVLK